MEQACIDDLKKEKEEKEEKKYFLSYAVQWLSVVWHRVILLTDCHWIFIYAF